MQLFWFSFLAFATTQNEQTELSKEALVSELFELVECPRLSLRDSGEGVRKVVRMSQEVQITNKLVLEHSERNKSANQSKDDSDSASQSSDVWKQVNEGFLFSNGYVDLLLCVDKFERVVIHILSLLEWFASVSWYFPFLLICKAQWISILTHKFKVTCRVCTFSKAISTDSVCKFWELVPNVYLGAWWWVINSDFHWLYEHVVEVQRVIIFNKTRIVCKGIKLKFKVIEKLLDFRICLASIWR